MRIAAWTAVFYLLIVFGFGNQAFAGDAQLFRNLLDDLESLPPEMHDVLVESFMASMSHATFPLVEDTLAYFIYRPKGPVGMTVAGDFNGWNPNADAMTRAKQTNLYYLVKSFERDARLDYKIVMRGVNWVLDPKNPAQVSGGFGPNSELAMPGYVQPEEILYDPGIPHGAIDTIRFHSEILSNDRNVYVYLPPGYGDSGSKRYPFLLVNDGGEYISLGSMNNILDNMTARGDIPAMIAVFADPVSRNYEYRMNAGYKLMVIDELVPLIDSKYRTDPEPSKRGIMGASLGGLISVYIATDHPGVFGFCAGHSGAYYMDENLIAGEISRSAKKDIVFYLDWGTYEVKIAASNIVLRDVLLEKGYKVTFNEFHEGHSWGSWRAHTDDILKAFHRH